MRFWKFLILSTVFLLVPPILAGAASTATMNVVGLYSETAAGSVSYRIGNGQWIVVKVGDKIPDNAEIGITVDRGLGRSMSGQQPQCGL